MAISASRVTRFGVAGGIARPAGSFAGKTPFVADDSPMEWHSSTIDDVSFIPGDLIPDVTNARNIGSETKEWKDLFLTRLLRLNSVDGYAGGSGPLALSNRMYLYVTEVASVQQLNIQWENNSDVVAIDD